MVNIADEYKYLVKVILFDSSNRIVFPVEESLSTYKYYINKGLYTIRIEMNSEVSDKIITVNKDRDYLVASNNFKLPHSNIIEPPQQFSSALLGGDNVNTYGSSYEYYTSPAIEFSRNSTFDYSGGNLITANSSLFIFMRFPSLEKYKDLREKWDKSFYRDFEIVNDFGEPIIIFDSQVGIVVNEYDGWIAFNAVLPHGIYYLIYHGKEPRQIPIYVFKNWHTQFFITLGEVPLFGTIRIFISKMREFNPKDETNKYIDILLDKLQNKDYSIDENLIEIVASGKYESPMLGLICSYIYLKGAQKKNDNLFYRISNNLRQVILKDNDESPDLQALDILLVEHLGNTNYSKRDVKGTPMLRIGFEAIKNASVKNNTLIPMNSINDFISETLYYDSPFNTFQPIKYSRNSISGLDLENILYKNKFRRYSKPYFSPNEILQNTSSSENIVGQVSSQLDLSIRNVLTPRVIHLIKNSDINSDSKENWIRTSISDMINQNDNLSINEISNQLNLSGSTISRIFEDWKREVGGSK